MPKPTNIQKKTVTTNVRSPKVRSTIQKPSTKSISQYTDTGTSQKSSAIKITKPKTETYNFSSNTNMIDKKK